MYPWNRRLCLSILAVLLILAVSGCYQQRSASYIDFRQPAPMPVRIAGPDAAQRPLLIALATVLTPQETISQYRQIADFVSRQTGHQTVLVQRKTYEEVNMLLANGDVDIAFLSTGAYSSYRGMNEIELLAMTEYEGTILYTAEVIVHKDSTATSLDDLQGKVFTFTDPLSYSGHMVIEEYLRKQAALPETFFQRYFYTYSHDKSLWAVANKMADGASLDSQILEYAKLTTPELYNKIRIIATIGAAPTGPVAIKKSMSAEQKEKLQAVFWAMHQDQATQQAMKKIMIDRFVKPTPELYEPLKKLYDRTRDAL